LVESLQAGVARAHQVLADGSALGKFEALVAYA
jgi:anthranilate phosphoribosyltransferase